MNKAFKMFNKEPMFGKTQVKGCLTHNIRTDTHKDTQTTDGNKHQQLAALHTGDNGQQVNIFY